MKKPNFGIFMCLLTLIGCRKESSDEEHIIWNYFPLKVGNVWVYEGTLKYNGDGSNNWISNESLKVIAKYDWDGNDVFKVIELINRHDSATNDTFSYTDTSYYVYYEEEPCELRFYFDPPEYSGDFFKILLKEPLEEGTEWTYFGSSYYWAKIDNMGFEDTISAGIFKNCLGVSGYDPHFYDYTILYARGVGKIYYSSWWPSTPHIDHQMELVSYTVK